MTKSTPLVKDKDSNIMGNEQKKLERWPEHFSELLNAEINLMLTVVPLIERKLFELVRV